MKTRQTAETQARFGPLDWALSVGMALTWGSSFLLIDIAIRHFHSAVVPFGRTGFGVLALMLFPSARKPIARQHWPRLLVLGFTWMALPFLLYPLAEQTVSSSITSMINGGLPIVVAVVTAIWVRTLPSTRRIVAVLIGFGGIALIALPSINHGTAADVKGILLLIIALLSYAVAINVARPLQAIYSPANLMLYVEIVAFTMSVPYGFWGISQSEFNLGSLGALAILCVLGTGFAFVLFALLNQRAGTARSMIPTYFTPVVCAVLGTAFNSEPLLALSIVGILIVIFGALLTSKPEVPKIISATPTQ